METTIKWFEPEEKIPEYGSDGFSRDLFVITHYDDVYLAYAFKDADGECVISYGKGEDYSIKAYKYWAYAKYPFEGHMSYG